jgi:hypothetical protein
MINLIKSVFGTKLNQSPVSHFYSSRAIPLTGPFVTMIYSMILGDMTTFSIIYIIFLFGFTQAFYFIVKSHEDPDLVQSLKN